MLKFKSRLQLGWAHHYNYGSLSANLFVNYDGAYKMDRALLPAGVPESYGDIASRATEDVSPRL